MERDRLIYVILGWLLAGRRARRSQSSLETANHLEPLVFFTHGGVESSGGLVRASNKVLAYQIVERIFVQ